jgi:biotin carboxyl carrier protein
MTCEVETRGRRRTIEVQRAGQDWVVTLDGRTMAVSVTVVEGRWSLLIGPSSIGPPDGGPGDDGRPMKSYEIALDGRGNGDRIVHVNGLAVPVAMRDPRARLVRGPAVVASAGAGPRSVVAPMPGRIVKVLVAVGDSVAAHQGLVVVEAMKMENELRAPRAGTVIDVRVRDGMSVDRNAVLVVIE